MAGEFRDAGAGDRNTEPAQRVAGFFGDGSLLLFDCLWLRLFTLGRLFNCFGCGFLLLLLGSLLLCRCCLLFDLGIGCSSELSTC